MLTNISAGGRRAVVLIPPLWLNADQTPNGFATSNAEKGAELRAAYLTLAAKNGALIVDLQQITGQILGDFMVTPDLSDARIRDRIHHTPFVYRLLGQYVARVIAGDVVKEASPIIDGIAVPAIYFQNSWHSTIQAPYMTISSRRDVSIDGILEAGTKTAGTAIMVLPANMRPNRTFRFDARSVRNSDGRITRIRLQLDALGALTVYDMPSDDDIVFLDSVSYRAM
jgi:hypothetical protein